MNTHAALKCSIDAGQLVAMNYLGDLSDEEMLLRPTPAMNHINWQVGHLILSEHQMMERVKPGAMPPLPEGFEQKYSREAIGSDTPADFLTKAELMQAFESQRSATLALLDSLTVEELDRETGVPYAPTAGAAFSLQGSHWLMHAGQWAVVRRQLGRPPLI